MPLQPEDLPGVRGMFALAGVVILILCVAGFLGAIWALSQ